MTDRLDKDFGSGELKRAVTLEEGVVLASSQKNKQQVDFAELLIHMNNRELDSNGQASSNINSPAMGQSHHFFGQGGGAGGAGPNYLSSNRYEIGSFKDFHLHQKGGGLHSHRGVQRGKNNTEASAFSKALRFYKA